MNARGNEIPKPSGERPTRKAARRVDPSKGMAAPSQPRIHRPRGMGHTGDEERVTLWRCERCGHWSHAQRRPRAHTRYISEYHPDLDEFTEVEIEWVDNGIESETGAPIYSGKVRCGPFAEWQAERAHRPEFAPYSDEHGEVF